LKNPKKLIIIILVLVILLAAAAVYYFYYYNTDTEEMIEMDDHQESEEDIKENTEEENEGTGAKTVEEEIDENGIQGGEEDEKVDKEQSEEKIEEQQEEEETGTEDDESSETDARVEDTKTEDTLKYRYSYRNPFKDYESVYQETQPVVAEVKTTQTEIFEYESEAEPELNSETVRNFIPFRLTGIIGTKELRLAIIEEQGGSFVISKGERRGDFLIRDILEDSIVLEYRGISLTLELGSDKR